MRHDVPRLGAGPAQPSSNLADQLERITPRFDELTQRARLGVESADDFNQLEELAQGIARDVVAPFRGARPPRGNQPLFVSADRTRAAW